MNDGVYEWNMAKAWQAYCCVRLDDNCIISERPSSVAPPGASFSSTSPSATLPRIVITTATFSKAILTELGAGASLINVEHASHPLLAVESGDRGLGISLRVHLHKPEAP